MQISEKIIQNLKREKVKLEQYFYLYCIANELSWATDLKLNKATWLKTLIRRGYLNDMVITPKGQALLEGDPYQEEDSDITITPQGQVQKMNEDFERFWKEYPVSDKHGRWKRTRYFRSGKEEARAKFFSILGEGITADQLIAAVRAEVKIKKENSLIENQMAFMPLINSWLNKRKFEGYLEDEDDDEIQETKYGQDID